MIIKNPMASLIPYCSFIEISIAKNNLHIVVFSPVFNNIKEGVLRFFSVLPFNIDDSCSPDFSVKNLPPNISKVLEGKTVSKMEHAIITNGNKY